MFSQVYFSVAVCLRGLHHHSVSSWLGPCVSFDAPPQLHDPSQENSKREGLIDIRFPIYKLGQELIPGAAVVINQMDSVFAGFNFLW